MLKAMFMRFYYVGYKTSDEEVVSSKKNIPIKTRAHKPYPISDQNGQIDTLFQTKTA